MTMPADQLNRLLVLCGALRDGAITDGQFVELNAMLEKYAWAREYYLDYVYLCTDLCHFQSATQHLPDGFDVTPSPSVTLEMLRAMGEYENTAEAVVVPEPEQKMVVTKAHVETVPHRVSRLSIVTFVTSLAAMLMMMAYVVMNPRTTYEVATLIDAIQSQWTSPLALQKGVRLTASSEPIELHKGVVKFESDKGVHIVLEAPAKFNFVSPDEIVLHHGRIFASVPEQGNGFTVQTSNAKIIDLGTQFGVYADLKGETELHMFQGKTLLIAGQRHRPKQTIEVASGRALRVDYTGHEIKDIPLRGDVFAQDIDSGTGLSQRGRTVINLADVVGGGNGFGTGEQNVGIDLVTGDFRKAQSETRRQSNTFIPVAANAFVNGVFVPNGETRQIVSSAGHTFAECPPTSGYFFADIVNTPSSVSHTSAQTQFPLVLGDVNYSQPENPSILLHSNVGITFDLNAFRSRFPAAQVTRFLSEVGISDSAPKSYGADFRVLIDGQVRSQNTELMQRGAVETISVAIDEEDRFLTLVVTDGGVYDELEDRHGIGYDWCVFGRPVLVVE